MLLGKTIAILSILLLVNVCLSASEKIPQSSDAVIEEDVNTNKDLKNGSSFNLVSRYDWIAQPPREPLTKLELPLEMVIIAHTVTENCSTQAACTFRVRFMQTFHMESRGWDDIAYNFMVGGDGSVYEGRGWDFVGVHTKGYNRKSFGIAFIGTFSYIAPPQQQIDAALNLIQEGVNLGKLDINYKLYGHRQLAATASPGDVLYDIIKKWPHWTDTLN